MASAFDYNRAPFFQSFMEVRVERSANRVRLLLYGANGPLHWRDLQRSWRLATDLPSDAAVEFRLPLPPRLSSPVLRGGSGEGVETSPFPPGPSPYPSPQSTGEGAERPASRGASQLHAYNPAP